MIIIGPAGSGLITPEGFEKVNSAGFKALEVEFTYQVFLNNKQAQEFGKLAKKHNLDLSIHASYFINLASADKKKITASKKRILQACERGHHLGARCIVFHPAFYVKHSKEECYNIVKRQILDMQKTIKQKKWKVLLCPETTGKQSQFGSLDELLRLKKETKCGICIDFAHLKARDIGKINYKEVMEKIKHLKKIHCHFSGIEYGPKGERKHLITKANHIKELLKWLKKYKINATIINESPDPFGDTMKTKKILESL